MSESAKLNLLSVAQIQLARQQAQATGQRLLEALQEKLALNAAELTQLLGKSFKLPTLGIRELQALKPAFDILPFSEALQKQALAFYDEQDRLLVVYADPFDLTLQDWLEDRMKQTFSRCLAPREDIVAFLNSYEETQRAMDSVLTVVHEGAELALAIEDISLKTIAEDTSPVVKLVNSTLYDALKSNVSDIHIETSPTSLMIKYRIDGVLSIVGTMPGLELAEQVISRLKVMSELDISERRIPQDGRFKVLVNGREIDFRVSIIPSLFGEDAVLRILDKQAVSDQIQGLRLDSLGFDEATVTLMRRLSTEPYGMLLVTGPTGSGKTTTLYGAISEINSGQDKIITIEDPVEYQLAGVLQIPVNEKKGLTFARGLRSILRHDPDKIMVGEIRDAETAQIAVQAALTGHLVFTTVHANNIFDVLGRFMHMGVEAYSFVSALNGILAQRLIRLNCKQCVETYVPERQLLLDSGLDPDKVEDYHFRSGRGCGSCRGTGYKGRKAIAEVLHLNDPMRELIISRAPISQLKELAHRHGTRFLRELALEAVRQGETTLQEINRVTFVE